MLFYADSLFGYVKSYLFLDILLVDFSLFDIMCVYVCMCMYRSIVSFVQLYILIICSAIP
jgi:hypothetical protein